MHRLEMHRAKMHRAEGGSTMKILKMIMEFSEGFMTRVDSLHGFTD